MQEEYKTLLKASKYDFIINKSQFIANCSPVNTEEDARGFLEKIKKEHSQARHNCYAYIIGKDIFRYSDDGEPSGTAGMPMLQCLKAKDLSNCIVVATRYFGGILLGTGGLLRAYQKCAIEGIKQSHIIVMSQSLRLNMQIDYSTWSKIENKLRQENLIIENIEYSNLVDIAFIIKFADQEKIKTNIYDMSQGLARINEIEQMYYPWEV